jgi:D-alanyl-D-alanine carboxypeptidase/D-alanyl-D-alanine-endopeptidase (penicillin-binding protein 4)
MVLFLTLFLAWPAVARTGKNRCPLSARSKSGQGLKSTNEALKPESNDPNCERIQKLQEALDGVVRGNPLGRLRVGIRVEDLTTGRVLYGRGSQHLMDPASNQKILAMATALIRLGGEYQFRTQVLGPVPDDEGTVMGDVMLQGSGDPSLRLVDLHALANDLVRRGVTVVAGNVLGDPRRIGTTEPAIGRSPLQLGAGSVWIRVSPGERVGDPGMVSINPESDAYVVVNRTETRVKGRGKLSVVLSQDTDKIHVLVAGTIRHGGVDMVMRRPPPNHTLFAAILLHRAMVQAGIEVRGQPGVGWEGQPSKVTKTPHIAGSFLASTTSGPFLLETPHPNSSDLLALHESAPLSLIIRRVNKISDNEWAERVLEQVGAEVQGGVASTAKGIRVLRDVLGELGIPSEGYLSTNGSGLGHSNRIKPVALVELLRKLYFDPRIGPELTQSLSVGGVDGTTRNRFLGTPSAERVRAKTGTLQGVSCLSGYVGEGPDVVVFSILVEGHRRRGVAAVRAAQVSAVNAMMSYTRRHTSEEAAKEGLPSGIDYETGDGESLETIE